MKKTYLMLTVVLWSSARVLLWAQHDIPDDSQARQPILQVSAGLGGQFFYPAFKMSHFAVEMPIGPYQQIGLIGNILLRNYSTSTYSEGIGGNSYELGFLYKVFFRGRLSARRSAFYWGADVRAGRRKYFETDGFFGGGSNYRELEANSLKVLALSGIQYRLGVALLEFSMPVGLERNAAKSPEADWAGSYFFSEAIGLHPIVSPQISLGFSLSKPVKATQKHRKH